MTVLNFPGSTSNGDTYTSNGVTYTYNNGGWTSGSEASLNAVYVNVSGDTMTGTLTVPKITSPHFDLESLPPLPA